MSDSVVWKVNLCRKILTSGGNCFFRVCRENLKQHKHGNKPLRTLYIITQSALLTSKHVFKKKVTQRCKGTSIGMDGHGSGMTSVRQY